MFNKILILCVGNICRSPMGEALFKHHFSAQNRNLHISSAGLGALVGYPADPMVQEILSHEGIDCSAHRARQVTAEMVTASDLVLVMENSHRDQVIHSYPSSCGKVFLIGKWSNVEVLDPYKKSKSAFTEAYALIKQGMQDWEKKLWN